MTTLTTVGYGRICLFGEHQDYLGLPVLAAAVQLCITITGTPRAERVMTLELPDIGERHTYPLDDALPYAHTRDYLPAALNVLRREGVVPDTGWQCTVRGTIPINAGTSSSSALVVAWVRFLLAAAGASRTPAEVAVLANRAEVLEFGEPGGLMDHYLSALGGVHYLDFRETPTLVEPLPAPPPGFVLGDSREPKATTDVLRRAREEAEAAAAWVRAREPALDLRTSPRAAFDAVLAEMPAPLRRKLEGNLINRDLCQAGRALLASPGFDPAALGALLLEHHRRLSDDIGVSTPKLDAMVRAACDAGALGGKLNGSGGGGCMFAYAPGREEAVAAALEAAGGRAYRLAIPPPVGESPHI
jgi:galactokinase